MKATLRPIDRLRQRPGIEVRALPKGSLLVDMDTGTVFRLNRVGAEIWALLRAPVACAEVFVEVAKRYGLPAKQAENEVGALLEELLDGALVELVAGEP